MIGNNERLEETAKRIFAYFIEVRQQFDMIVRHFEALQKGIEEY